MAISEKNRLAKTHYIIRRSRSGRFNFALITDAGRFTGSVFTEIDDRPSSEIERHAREKIRALAESFAEATGLVVYAASGSQTEREVVSNHSSGKLAT